MAPHPSAARLIVRLIGKLEITLDGVPLRTGRIVGVNPIDVWAFLQLVIEQGCRDRRTPVELREAVAKRCWPTAASPSKSLREALSRLRTRLELHDVLPGYSDELLPVNEESPDLWVDFWQVVEGASRGTVDDLDMVWQSFCRGGGILTETGQVCWPRVVQLHYAAALEAAAAREERLQFPDRATSYLQRAAAVRRGLGSNADDAEAAAERAVRLVNLAVRQRSRQVLSQAINLLPTELKHSPLVSQAWEDVGKPPPPIALPSTVHLGPFVGRDLDLRRVLDRLTDHRVAVVWGLGGIGKSQLLAQVARRAAASLSCGAVMVDLAPCSTEAAVYSEVRRGLNLPPTSLPSRDAVVEFLASRQILLVLDTAERQPEVTVEFACYLLRHCPRLSLLLGGQQRLDTGQPLRDEVAYHLGPLELPPSERLGVSELRRYAAVTAFVEHARSVLPDYQLTAANAPQVATACIKLDGIPLAIKLAARRIEELGMERIIAQLSERLSLLQGGAPNPRRHSSMRAVLEWSVGFLERDDRILLRRLGAFAGVWSLERAEAVCQGGDLTEGDVANRLRHLTDCGLVDRHGHQGEAVWTMPDTVREFARTLLARAGEDRLADHRQAFYVRRFVEEAALHYRGDAQRKWFDRVEAEHANIRRALEFYLTAPGSARTCLTFVHNVWEFWLARGYAKEGLHWAERALARPGAQRPCRDRGYALHGAAGLALSLGDSQTARRYLTESLAIATAHRDAWAGATATADLVVTGPTVGDPALTRQALQQSLDMLRSLGEEHGERVVLANLGRFEYGQGHLELAREYLEEALAMENRAGDMHGAGITLQSLVDVYREMGEVNAALVAAREARHIATTLADPLSEAFAGLALAAALASSGATRQALNLYRQAIADVDKIAGTYPLPGVLEEIAELIWHHSQREQSIVLMAAAETLRDLTGKRPTRQRDTRTRELLDRMRTERGEAEFDALWACGKALSRDQALDLLSALCRMRWDRAKGRDKDPGLREAA